MLVPYFTVLIILSMYGLHRYETMRTYLKHRKKLTDIPPVRFDELPRVTIQLPLYNERYVVERLIEETCKVDYPRHLLQIQVLDDSTDETAPVHRTPGERVQSPGPSDRVSPPHEPARLQGRRVAGRHPARHRRVHGRVRRRLPSAARFPDAHDALLRRPECRRGANSLDVSQPRSQPPDRSAGDAAGRPLRPGTWRALRPRTVLQLQRHGRNPAQRR